MRLPRFVAVAAVAVFAFSVAACGSGDDAQTASPPAAPSAAMSSAPAMADGEFGAGCAAVPTDPANAGSFEAMAQVPAATAASGNPLLSTLVSAVKQAGLVDSLNGADNVTVFAPTNDAFAKIPKADLEAVLADKEKLTQILTYHVVPGGQLAPEKLSGMHATLEGQQVDVKGSGTDFSVNGTSKVVCGNVKTANATVYIVDSVLMPPA
ncbi:Uncaracterized surface protein containing fasciclin (FAS1) repeats [Asanoa hainanensis]|uniref:Uncaracterized surface protein containing fasciclin (FAS1) repeats n=1 Tax=Asanoa hainanensis TaxID=560556 RepID=A0A239N7T0_9ACTN|nr:fasciclin domain-containing protein [Asanoa hainanensis]SNT50248.1 Uncaracterized surface protein containing fasciclin (FAS1) repeats [Asanoa hainanensis]